MPQTATRPGVSRTDVALADGCSDGRATRAAYVAASTNARSGARLELREMGVGVTENGQSSERGAFAMFSTLTGIATLSAVLVVGGAGLGLLVDSWTSSPHVFVFLGLVLGVLTAVLATRSIVQRFFR
jgi:F0F1-type ATP synthase assembly protein I